MWSKALRGTAPLLFGPRREAKAFLSRMATASLARLGPGGRPLGVVLFSVVMPPVRSVR